MVMVLMSMGSSLHAMCLYRPHFPDEVLGLMRGSSALNCIPHSRHVALMHAFSVPL